MSMGKSKIKFGEVLHWLVMIHTILMTRRSSHSREIKTSKQNDYGKASAYVFRQKGRVLD